MQLGVIREILSRLEDDFVFMLKGFARIVTVNIDLLFQPFGGDDA
jgi:hypothetical protein